MVRTIKFFQMLLIFGGICIATLSKAEYQLTRGPGDDTHPWPWGFEVKFPWDEVQGIWRAEDEGKAVYFSFHRIQEKRVKIKQIDFETCSVIGTGQGLERDKTLVAQIITNRSIEPYNLTMYAFNEEDSKKPPLINQAGQDHVIVARISRFNHPGFDFVAQMVRISENFDYKCGPQGKKIEF
ncbi:MAG: hypothetical protein ACXWRA_04040 [Pseudobdellovibrionaceae bacterium]